MNITKQEAARSVDLRQSAAEEVDVSQQLLNSFWTGGLHGSQTHWNNLEAIYQKTNVSRCVFLLETWSTGCCMSGLGLAAVVPVSASTSRVWNIYSYKLFTGWTLTKGDIWTSLKYLTCFQRLDWCFQVSVSLTTFSGDWGLWALYDYAELFMS